MQGEQIEQQQALNETIRDVQSLGRAAVAAHTAAAADARTINQSKPCDQRRWKLSFMRLNTARAPNAMM